MKRMSKKLSAILLSALVVVFFCGITLVMASTGKIDLSNVPVVNSIVNFLSSGNVNSETLLKAVATDVRPSEDYTSITDVAVVDGFIYSADKTGMKVYKSNKGGEVVATYQADSQVNGVFVNDSTVYALVGGADGKVIVLDTALKASKTINVGHTPSAMAVSGDKGYIANRFNNSVSVIDLNTNTVIKTVSINGREAIDLAVAKGKLYVACHLPDRYL